jgi:flagellar protein FlgJ
MDIDALSSLPSLGPFDLTSPGHQTDEQVLEEFESLFLSNLLKKARSQEEDDEDSLIPRSPGRDLVEDLFDTMLSREIARGGGLGLAENLRQRMKDAQDEQPAKGEETTR